MIYTILDMATTAALLFIISSGLLIIFGVMGLINFSHGSFIAVGGYVAVVVANLDMNPWWSIPLSFLVGGCLGVVTEQLIARFLYHRPLDAILATWGLGIVITELIVVAFGRTVQFAGSPISGAFEILGFPYSAYRLALIPAACVVGLVMFLVLNKTRLGLDTRAVISNSSLAEALGVNSARVRLLMFAFGAGLATLSGALMTPLASVTPNMGLPWLVSAFMLVLVSGNSLLALVMASVILGSVQSLVSYYLSPVLGGVTLAFLGALLLRLRPQGFQLN